ncbi:MAG: protoporphyrinogen oxidase [Syntrophaceae bacterium]|nr:protoporphyrinogen oxidase [Syntrophaceae bacterium]
MKRLVIVGGGIAGLATAYFALEKTKALGEPVHLQLLEEKDRLGGCILTEKVNDFVIEGGPDCFLYEKPWALALCEKLGLGERILNTNENRRVFILSKGKLHELPEGFMLMVPTSFMPFIRSSLISWPGKIRMAMDLFIPRKRSDEEESLADFVRRRLGKEALEKIAEPLVAGIHAGTPETMGLKSTFPRFLQIEEEYGSLIRGMLARRKMVRKWEKQAGPRRTMFLTLKGGLGEWIDRLREKIGEERIGLKRRVTKVRRGERGIYQVQLSDGTALEADVIILATPSFVTARIIEEMDLELSKILLTIPYVSSATVSLAYRRSQIDHPLDAFGFIVPRSEKRRIMASTWTSIKFNHRAPRDAVLLRAFVGGANNEGLVSLDDEEMLRVVREELKDIMGIEGDPILVKIYRWEKSMPQYLVGHLEKVGRIEERVGLQSGIFITGCAYKGIGISDAVHDAEIVAEKAVEYLKGA